MARTPKPALDRIMRVTRVDSDGCWIWQGHTNQGGYGYIHLRLGPKSYYRARAHRAAYELLVGPIPDGLELDHRCHTDDSSCRGGSACKHRRCVNPDHLEPVTRAENNARRFGLIGSPGQCVRGHPFDEANTYYRRSNGRRDCRACGAARHAAARAAA